LKKYFFLGIQWLACLFFPCYFYRFCIKKCKTKSTYCTEGGHWVHYNCEKLSNKEIENVEQGQNSEYTCTICIFLAIQWLSCLFLPCYFYKLCMCIHYSVLVLRFLFLYLIISHKMTEQLTKLLQARLVDNSTRPQETDELSNPPISSSSSINCIKCKKKYKTRGRI
jgi:hypothetical protein